MSLNKLVPVLYTREIAATIAFYEKILEFTCRLSANFPGTAFLRKDDVEIMVSEPNEHIPFTSPTFTGSFYFRTEQVDELWESLSAKAAVVYDIEDFEYGMREFAIYDNNGYVLQFGQEIEP